MAYYFMVEAKKGKYEPIEIKKSRFFNVEKKQYVKPGAYGLKEIDLFTTQFRNEADLRIHLIEEDLLKKEDINRSLSIRFYNKNEYTKVKYDFLYEKDLKYIKNPELLIKFVLDQFYQNDFVFIQKLVENFSRYHECANTASDVMYGAAHSMYNGYRHEILDILDINGDLFITRLLKLLIYQHTTDYSGYIRYKNEVNYRNLHTIIAFINNYYKDKTYKETEKPKTKTKEITEQISLFDQNKTTR